MRSQTAVHPATRGSNSDQGDLRGAFPQVNSGVVGLAGLEPAASSLSGFCPRARFRRIAPATCETTYRWRPLRTARFRWRVDQTWTKPGSEAGGPVPSGCGRLRRPGCWAARPRSSYIACPARAAPSRRRDDLDPGADLAARLVGTGWRCVVAVAQRPLLDPDALRRAEVGEAWVIAAGRRLHSEEPRRLVFHPLGVMRGHRRECLVTSRAHLGSWGFGEGRWVVWR